MALDKKHFHGGLNRDDDSRVAKDGDYHYAQNIRVLSSEGRNAMLVENIKGTKIGADGAVDMNSSEGKLMDNYATFVVIGTYEDKPTSCIYYFLWAENHYHRILEYNINTDTINTVFRDTGDELDNVLNFRKEVLVTGINKIDDILYWTYDSTFKDSKYTQAKNQGAGGATWGPDVSSKFRVEANNEPKFINVERAKKGWTTYWNGGSFNSNPITGYDITDSYPYEFYSSAGLDESGKEESASLITGERKRLYVDVCHKKPISPFYTFQTPIVNLSSSPITPTAEGSTTFTAIASGATSYQNISIEQIVSNPNLDVKYKKNNLYGFNWQFAYRYVYKDNEVGAYSEWSAMYPSPQYYANKLEKEKQSYYNQIRIWYSNGPANVEKIEIVARKLNYNPGVEEEGNQGKFYLIATVENNYYDSSYSHNEDNFVNIPNAPGDFTNVTTTNVPYIQSMTSSTPSTITYSEGNFPPFGFIDFRNDGVNVPVDPVQFEKLYDRVPLRAKSQEIIAANRLAYGNYVDGFDNTKVRYDLMPIYGDDFDPINGVLEEHNGGGGIMTTPVETVTGGTPSSYIPWGGAGINTDIVSELGLNSDHFGAAPTLTWERQSVYADNVMDSNNGYGNVAGELGHSDIDDGVPNPVLCWNTDAIRGKVTYTFPTVVTGSQEIHIKFNFRVRFKSKFGSEATAGVDDDNSGWHYFPHENWHSNWLPYRYKFFGAQLDIKYKVGTSTVSELIDTIVEDIDKISQQTWSDKLQFCPVVGSSPSNEPSGFEVSDDVMEPNPMSGTPINHLWKQDADGNQTYLSSGTQGAAEMRMYAKRSGSNKINIFFVPYGQPVSEGSTTNMCNGGTWGSDGDDRKPDLDHRECTGCGVYGSTQSSTETPETENLRYLARDYSTGSPCLSLTEPGSYDWNEANGTNSDCQVNLPPMIDQSGGTNGATTNIHIWKDDTDPSDGDSDYKDVTRCGNVNQACGPFREEGCYDSFYAVSTGKYCGQGDDGDGGASPSTSGGGGFDSTGGGFNTIGTPDTSTWSIITTVNVGWSQIINMANQAGCFKSGAWHRFGIVYYDYKGRNSMVQLQEPSISDSNQKSSVYVKFPTERIYKEGMGGISSETLEDYKKKLPALIGWKIYNKPPIWAEYYHWVYARNTSVSKFMWFTIDRAYINKGAKPGTTAVDAKNDTKVYLSLNTMDGRDWSYNQKNRSLVGDWSFAEGDRMRIITDSDGIIMHDLENPDVQAYYDFKLSDVAGYPGRFDMDTAADGADEDADANISAKLRLSMDSPVGGAQGKPHEAKPGKFLVLDEVALTGYGVADGEESDDGEVRKWRNVTIEIYRPKKIKEEELSLYYEFSEKYKIHNPGHATRSHSGPVTSQGSTYTTNDDGIEVTSDYASGIFYRGDIWYKKRYMTKKDENGNSTNWELFCEDYFLNDFLNTNHNNIARPHLPSTYAKEQRRKASVTYSDVYQPDTSYNGLHSFPFNQRPYMDYDLSQGSIQSMVSRDTDLVLLQEDKISKVMVNKNIINTPGGDSSISLSTDVLSETASPYTGNYGVCLNPESIAVFGKVIYFVDIKRGAVLRLSNDGLTAISDYKMTDYFRDKMDSYQSILESEYNDKLNGPLKILGGYDPRHSEYIITFPHIYKTISSAVEDRPKALFSTNAVNFNDNSDNWEKVQVAERKKTALIEKDETEDLVLDRYRTISTRAETISFSEKANRWVTFYTYYPDYYATLHRKFISFKWGALFLHDESEDKHAMFHWDKMPNEMRLDFAFNSDVSTVKSWQNLSIEGIDRNEIIPIVGDSITVSASSTGVSGSGTSFKSNNIEVGDDLYTYTPNVVNPSLLKIGTISSIASDTAMGMSANSTQSATFTDSFIIPAKKSMYDTRFKTNINESKVNHRLGYNNSYNTAGSWVIREDVGSVRIPYGVTNSSGGEYHGLGYGSIADNSTQILSNTVYNGSGDAIANNFGNQSAVKYNSVYYYDNDVEYLIGVVASCPAATGVLISETNGYSKTIEPTTIAVDTVNPTTVFANGDRVSDDKGLIIGTVTSASSGTITLDAIGYDLVNNQELYNYDRIKLQENFTSGPISNKFMYIKKDAAIEGDRLKGHYMETELTKRTKDKVQIYAANANISKSELSNK